MRRSRLGNYIWNQRRSRGIKRLRLARIIGCNRNAIANLEDRGDDEEWILDRLIEPLKLDPTIIDQRSVEDKEHRLAWLNYCGFPEPPIIVATRTPIGCPKKIPARIIRAGNDAIELYAIRFAKKWKRKVELFIRNHVRFVIHPTGEIEINELGYYPPLWMDAES